MDFSRTVAVAGSTDELWELTRDVKAVAECIPGVQDLAMTGPGEFTCLLVQQVGSVKAKFALRTRLETDEVARTVTAVSSGQDRGLGSSVKATQRFAVSQAGKGAEVAIQADVQITGRIATFGHRIIAAKAEQVTVEAIRNVERMLAERRVDGQPAAPSA
jgi:uncharacterized protein